MFVSDRERRPWLWTLVLVMAIYSTLGLAPALACALRDWEVLDATFATGLLLAVTIVALSLRSRPRGLEIGIALGVGAMYVVVISRLALLLEERTHLIEYGVVAVFIYEGLKERASHGHRVPAPALLAILLTVALGILDELIQLLLPDRVFDPVDIAFNSLAAVMAVATSAALV